MPVFCKANIGPHDSFMQKPTHPSFGWVKLIVDR